MEILETDTIHSIAHNSYLTLLQQWVGNWSTWFVDHAHGGFFERLDANACPLDLGYKRLVTQCRQIYVHSYAYLLTGDKALLRTAQHGYEFINTYFKATHGLYFSVKANGEIYDQTRDLYGHAFVILCLSKYYQASQDPAALIFAKSTLNFLNTHCKSPIGGFHEALDDNLHIIQRVRRQNPHMHLLEACLSMYEVTQDEDYLATADNILSLLLEYFFDKETTTLREFFAQDFTPDPDKGYIVEPGHHFEWVWLIHKRLSLYPVQNNAAVLTSTMQQLFDWGRNYGIDRKYGGVFNEVNCNKEIVDADKRIWVITECIRAYCVMSLYRNMDAEKLELYKLFEVLKQHYIRSDGKWVEICNQDLSPKTDFMPGTTTYHIFINIVELYDIVRSLGLAKCT